MTDEPDLLGALQASLDRAHQSYRTRRQSLAEPTQEDGPAVSAEQGTTRLGLVESTELMLEIGRNVSAAPITAANYVLPAQPGGCECDKFLHEPGKPRCTNEPEDHGMVRGSPALCTRCLFYCYNDDDPF